MRLTIAQLSVRSRTSVATIKFYVRERLLPSGDLSAEHRAYYGQAHLTRLQVISALRNVGGLGIQTIRGLCALLDAPRRRDVGTVAARTMDALAVPTARASSKKTAVARREILRFLRRKKIRVRSRAATLDALAVAIVGLRQTVGPDIAARDMEPYLDAMRALAERDYRANAHLFKDPNTIAEAATLAIVFGTVLWEPVLVLLRRVALEDVAARHLAQR